MLLSQPHQNTAPPEIDRAPNRAGLELPPGPYDSESLIGDPRSCLGLLVTDGLITAHVAAGRAHVAWLIGAGDLIRPWDMAEVSLTRNAQWQVLANARIVPIERLRDPRSRRDPATVDMLLAHAARTSHWLLATSLIISSPSISERLLLLFALYGERWGKVTPDGVRIELPLTHELLGKLCGARRPTVTIAINSLTRAGFLTRASQGVWLLHRHPELSTAYPCWPDYATALAFDGEEATIAPRL